jgi:hypothetical protein
MTYRTASDFSQEELAALSLLDMLNPAGRKKEFPEVGLGEYGPENEHIKSLVKKGLVKLVGGKNVQLDKGKAKAELKKHRVPPKYKNKLTNWSMQFDTKSDKEAFVRVASSKEVHTELRRVMAYVEGEDGAPSREVLASWLETLAERVRG